MTAHEYALAQLRAEILRGELVGGQRLRQADIAARLGVSTTPVREALRDLATEGLVKFDSNRGAEVTSINMGEVRDLWTLRTVLEPLAMRIACERITSQQLAEAEEILDRMDAEDDTAVWLQLNREYHNVLQQATRIPALEKTLRLVQDQSAMYLAQRVEEAPNRPKAGQAEHRELLEALRARNADRAADVAQRHLEAILVGMADVADQGGAGPLAAAGITARPD
ncbi:GntR family transcriptional regulator [Geodermatophilus sp. SYSU D00815]